MGGGYDRALVERILPAMFDPDGMAWGMKNDQAADADMPKSPVDKKKGSSYLAHLTDVRAAWNHRTAAGLSQDEQRAVWLRFCLDLTVEEAGHILDCHKSSVTRRVERGVGKLCSFLNGERYVDGYDGSADDEAA